MEEEEEERIEKVWKEKWDKDRYLVGRVGDHLIMSFECDTCAFIRLKWRKPNGSNEKDRLLSACIRRVNLDAMWSRERATVAGNLRNVKKILRMSSSAGLEGTFVSHGPMPSSEISSYQLAVSMVLASRRPG